VRILLLLAYVVIALYPLVARADTRESLAPSLFDAGVVLGMTLLGGFVGWYGKVRKGELPAHSLFALIGEMATSSLAGLGSFFVCRSMGVSLGITAAVAGLCGYMGGRAMEMAERALQRRVDALAPAKD
jgi:hypothetical protein